MVLWLCCLMPSCHACCSMRTARTACMAARLQVEHDKFVAESEKRLAAGASEAEGLRRALEESEKATDAAAKAQSAAEARAGQAEEIARNRVANLTVRPKQSCASAV